MTRVAGIAVLSFADHPVLFAGHRQNLPNPSKTPSSSSLSFSEKSGLRLHGSGCDRGVDSLLMSVSVEG
jgi:hypothetical protein